MGSERETAKTAHGLLMIWAWGFLVPATVLLGTLGRGTFGGPLWFLLHRAIGVAAAGCTLLGLVQAYKIGTGIGRAKTHKLLGYATAAVGAAQPVLAFNRPDKATNPDGRDLWFAAHKYLGIASALFGLYNIQLGLRLWDPSTILTKVYSSGMVATGMVVVAWQVNAHL